MAEAGVAFSVHEGAAITTADWDFFYRCYTLDLPRRTTPRPTSRATSSRAWRETMAEHWLLFVARRGGERDRRVADRDRPASAAPPSAATGARRARALPALRGLLLPAAAWCIEQGYRRFEGGAQGEHKMARGLLPVQTWSAHWLAHPQFAHAVADFLAARGRTASRATRRAARAKRRAPFKAVEVARQHERERAGLRCTRAAPAFTCSSVQRGERRVDLLREREGAVRGRGCAASADASGSSCARDRRRKFSSAALAFGAVPAREAVLQRPRQLLAERAPRPWPRFCGAKIALAVPDRVCARASFQSTPLCTPYDRPSVSRMRFHRRELPPPPSR